MMIRLLFTTFAVCRNLIAMLIPSSHSVEPGGLCAALDEAMERFPNDPIVQEAKALATLEVREILGQRRYEA